MALKAKYLLGIKRYEEGASDAHGNPVESWAPVVFVKAYAIAPTSSVEPPEPGRAAVIDSLSVLLPDDVEIEAKDRAVYGGSEYTIEGNLANWNVGPFDFKPGFQLNLKKVSG
ncbi:hypothetical protein [Streptomyces sp. NPDC005385]|uniref:hypothetical protein n=1 Tax=Streptomyces sp. NPDC005385 TaxID=3157039 RepID=UPI0033B522AC